MLAFKFVLFLLFLNFLFVCALEKVEIKESKLNEDDEKSDLIDLQTRLGRLIGYKKQVQNETINVFYGVPYAEPPINKLRFRRTKLIRKFPQDPYDALKFKPHCAQRQAAKYNKNDKFSEDCLYMNIYTPNLASKVNGKCHKKFNVMVYIYGGTSSIFQMSPLVDEFNKTHLSYSGDLYPLHDTIIVLMNFRQELFGSLYLENEFNGNLGKVSFMNM